jgi:hypothetical protein
MWQPVLDNKLFDDFPHRLLAHAPQDTDIIVGLEPRLETGNTLLADPLLKTYNARQRYCSYPFRTLGTCDVSPTFFAGYSRARKPIH